MYINWTAPTIDILIVCGLPSDEYISTGPLRRLIYYLFVDYPPMINIFRLPSEPSSLDLYHALTEFQCIWNACMPVPIQSNHMQIYQHEYTRIISNHTIMSCN